VRALVVRLPHLFVLLVWHFIALRCFRVVVPVHIAMLYLPVVFAVAALPISVQGLGTAQVVARYYFSDYAAAGAGGGDEAVLAYSLSLTAIATVSNLVMGLLFLQRGARLGLSADAEQTARMEESLQKEAETTAPDDSSSPKSSEDGASGVRSVIYPSSDDRLILH
jgi:hypothetical protein